MELKCLVTAVPIRGNTVICFQITVVFYSLSSDFATEPEIENLTVSMSTISWSPPPCEANCTVSVDGQDIGTVPCSDGNLTTNDSNLRTKVVYVSALDGLGQSVFLDRDPDKGTV